MSRIKLNDLPQDAEISREEMKKVFGGMTKTLRPMDKNLITTRPGLANPGSIVSESNCGCCEDDCSIVNTGIRTNVTNVSR